MTDTPTVLDLREGDQVEFKEKFTDKCLEDACAFANTRGGILFIGVQKSDAFVQRVASAISDTLGLAPRMEWRVIEGADVLVISVTATDWLVACKGRHLARVGSTNRELSREEVSRRMLRQIGSSWDALATDCGPEVIDEGAVDRFVALVQEWNKDRLPHLDAGEPARSTLDKLDLLNGDRMTNAGMLLFGQSPQSLFRNARVRIAKVKEGEILAEHVQDGTLFDQLQGTVAALRSRFLNVRFEVTADGGGVESMQRQEVWEYPSVALREALNNALVHRDYMTAGDIQIRVYDDRLEIWNPGPLLNDLSPDLLRIDPHPSRRRNELLGEVFYKAGLIERWGTGTLRMIKSCRQQGLPEPEFVDNEGGGFKVVFRKDHLSEEQLRRSGVNERQIQAIIRLKETGAISNSEYQQLTGAEKRTASRDLSDLVERGILERVGATGRGTRYRLRP
jgi:ATP-dependent DNA helicase RecG